LKLTQTENGIQVAGKEAQEVSRLLNVAHAELLGALTERVIAARGEVMQKALTLTEAEYVRDALAKVCTGLFHWHALFYRIRFSIKTKIA